MCCVEPVLVAFSTGRGFCLPDGSALTAPEFGAVLARLDYPQRLILAARYGDHLAEKRWGRDGEFVRAFESGEAAEELRGWLIMRAAEESGRQRWRAGPGPLCAMARVVSQAVLAGKPPTVRAAAAGMDMARATYAKSAWPGRVGWLWEVAASLEREARRRVGEGVYSEMGRSVMV